MNNSRRAACALLALLSIALSACGSAAQGGDSVSSTDAGITEPAPAEVKMLDVLTLPIVSSDNAGDLMVRAATGLYKALSAHSSSAVITTDWVKDESTIDPNAAEIILGTTNRPAGKALQAELVPGTFAISATETQLLIVGADDVDSYRGVQYFIDEVLAGKVEGIEVGDGVLRIPVGYHYVSEVMDMGPSTILNSTDSFIAETKLVGPVPRIGNYKVMQGGVVTEDYAYFALINTADFPESAVEAYILKYDRETWKEVGRSKSLVLDHANDITYIPETNELYVVSCYVDSKRITVLDADTLEFKERKSRGGSNGAYALEYNPLRGQFVSGLGKTNMCIYDKDLNYVTYHQGKNTTLVTQGICADDKYIYHVLYSTKSNTEEPDNVIFVYDWDGNFITKIPIGIKSYEPENISLVGDTFYIACNNADWTGGIVFTAKIVKE